MIEFVPYIYICDRQGSIVNVKLQKEGRVGEAAEAQMTCRPDVEWNAFASCMLDILACLPDLHPHLRAKLRSVEQLSKWYFPREYGGHAVGPADDPLTILIEPDDELPF